MNTIRSNAVPLLLMLLVGICVSWLRSYWVADTIAFFTASGKLQAIVSIEGSLDLLGTSIVVDTEHPMSVHWQSAIPALVMTQIRNFVDGSPAPARYALGHFAFGFVDPYLGQPHARWFILRIPYWFPAALCFLTVTRSGWRWLMRRQRRKTGRCQQCGYDLRGSDLRCPECGEFMVLRDTR